MAVSLGKAMKCVLIVGSPRINGNSAKAASLLEKHFAFEQPEVQIERFDVADMDITGCNGCDYCQTEGQCIISDGANNILDALDTADVAYLVSPIYFGGVPSQCKAMLDRFQPLFWDRIELKREGKPLPEKRPLKVFLFGDSMGNDPHGYESALVSIRSAFALANFEIVSVKTFIGPKKNLSYESVVL